jgi:uncharacterized membrane protein
VRRLYGTTPLHLLAHGVLFAIFGWVVLQLLDARESFNILAWFVLAIVLHDLVLLPFYSTLDRLGRVAVPRAAVNYVRIPALLSGLLLLLFFPAILGRNDRSFGRVAGVEPSGYLERWLVVTAVLFAGALALYVLTVTKRAHSRA